MPKIYRWARLLLPNTQIAQSVWRENIQSSPDVRMSRMDEFKLVGHIMYREVVYFTCLAVPTDNEVILYIGRWLPVDNVGEGYVGEDIFFVIEQPGFSRHTGQVDEQLEDEDKDGKVE
ncbi:hypothetical protein V8E55_010333 [Tylopilus felleus]